MEYKYGIEAGKGNFTGSYFVMGYDDRHQIKIILSIHKTRAEAEDALASARAGKHSVQLEPGGTLHFADDEPE